MSVSAGEAGQPTVSALLETYNGAAMLRRALQGVLAQTYPVQEVIVVDDGSTDETPAMVAREFPSVRYLYQENTRALYCYERAYEHSSGELLAFCDMDDQWFPWKLERQVEVLRRYPEAALVNCHAVAVHAPEPWPVFPPLPEVREVEVEELPFGRWFDQSAARRFVPGFSNWLVRRSAVEDLGGLNPERKRNADYPFLLHLTARGHMVLGLREPLLFREQRPDSITRLDYWWRETIPRYLELLAEFDPRGEGPHRDLLPPAQYDAGLKRWLRRFLSWAVRAGDSEAAAELVRRAAALRGDQPLRDLELALARRCPGAYWAVRQAAERRRHRRRPGAGLSVPRGEE